MRRMLALVFTAVLALPGCVGARASGGVRDVPPPTSGGRSGESTTIQAGLANLAAEVSVFKQAVDKQTNHITAELAAIKMVAGRDVNEPVTGWILAASVPACFFVYVLLHRSHLFRSMKYAGNDPVRTAEGAVRMAAGAVDVAVNGGSKRRHGSSTAVRR